MSGAPNDKEDEVPEITPEMIDAGHEALRNGTNISEVADLCDSIGPERIRTLLTVIYRAMSRPLH